MNAQTDRLHEGLAALMAHKRFLTAVAAPVVAQLRCRLIGLGAQLALVWALRLVTQLMLAELPTVRELFPTAGTGKFANYAIAGASQVGLQMTQHTGHAGESFATCQALVAPTGSAIANLFFLVFLQFHFHTPLFFLCLSHLWGGHWLKPTGREIKVTNLSPPRQQVGIHISILAVLKS